MSIREAYAYRHRPECVRVLADFYWRAILSAALVALIFSTGIGFIKLSAVIGNGNDALTQSTGIVQPAPKLDKTQLQNTLDAFGKREARFNSLKTSAQKISDPSR